MYYTYKRYDASWLEFESSDGCLLSFNNHNNTTSFLVFATTTLAASSTPTRIPLSSHSRILSLGTMTRSTSLNITAVVNSNDGTSLRATRSSTRKQASLKAQNTTTDLYKTPVSKAAHSVGTRMVTRGRKVSLSPVTTEIPSPAKNTRSHAKAALALSKSIQTPSVSAGKKRSATDEAVTAPQKKKMRPTIGRWEQWEHLEFLKGLQEHGRGHWKVIAESIPTR